MTDSFSAEFFVGNRKRLRELFTGTAPIVLTANGLMQASADTAYQFKQDPNFWYLTGLNTPNVILVMDHNKEYLILPERAEIVETFDGKTETSALTARTGIDTILDEKEGWRQLTKRLKKALHLATVAPPSPYIEQWGMYTNPARARLMTRIKEINPEVELLDLRKHFMKMRMIKQPVEIEAIQHAIDITTATLKSALAPKAMLAYDHEYELEAKIIAGFRGRGGSGHAFDPIVAGGLNACTIHYMENNAPLNEHELVVVDVGAGYNHYAADITRTVAKGEPTKRQRLVHEAVRQIQEYGISLLKPGAIFWDCEQEIRRLTGEKLRELGLIRTIDDDAIHKYYPHMPHYLGLDVHDLGDYHVPLEEGMVVTIEPGIYIPEEQIGVRIEDDILITAEGATVMSEKLPREL